MIDVFSILFRKFLSKYFFFTSWLSLLKNKNKECGKVFRSFSNMITNKTIDSKDVIKLLVSVYFHSRLDGKCFTDVSFFFNIYSAISMLSLGNFVSDDSIPTRPAVCLAPMINYVSESFFKSHRHSRSQRAKTTLQCCSLFA